MSAPCVAPAWPEWACDEDGTVAWVRLDLEERAADLVAPIVDDFLRLARIGRFPMWLDLADVEWADGWLLRHVDLWSDPQDSVVYVKYEVIAS